MSSQDNTRRKQFSSCDACRKSRIRCITKSHDLRYHHCAHCEKRRLECTYEWLHSATPANQTKRRLRQNNITPAVSKPSEPRTLECLPNLDTPSDLHANGYEGLAQTLWTLFSSIFEPVFAIWLRPECCPYGDMSKATRMTPGSNSTPPISQIALYLDQQSCECPSKHLRNCVSIDPLIQTALSAAICYFSVRWLPLVNAPNSLDILARNLWLNARTALLKVIDRPSYISILSLYLFSMTPLPPGFDDEDADSHLGEVFVQIALRQFHVVRAKRRDRHFSGSKIIDRGPSEPNVTETFAYYESIMYWAGVIVDTSTSMTLGRPSTLCAGILGFEAEPILQLLRARSHIFHEDWAEDSIINDEKAMCLISSAAAGKGYCWKAISVLREAIVYGHRENEVEIAQNAVLNGLARYQTTYAPLLAKCERHLLFLNQATRLAWCK
jgi:hypothetical protein